MMSDKDHTNSNFWVGFFLGGIIGAFFIFFLGTKEGKKIVEGLIEKIQNYEDDLEEKATALQKKGHQIIKDTIVVKDKVTEELKDGKKILSSNLSKKINKTLNQIEDVQQKGIEFTKEVQKRVFRKNGKPLAKK